ncbi:hypothetical protein IWX91DRAFT_380344 [Phyllosticta citricarpa]
MDVFLRSPRRGLRFSDTEQPVAGKGDDRAQMAYYQRALGERQRYCILLPFIDVQYISIFTCFPLVFNSGISTSLLFELEKPQILLTGFHSRGLAPTGSMSGVMGVGVGVGVSLFGSAPTRESRDTVSDDLEKDYSHDLAWGKGLFRAQDKVELDRVGNLHDTPRSWIVVANVGAHSAAHVDSYGYCTYLSFQKGRAIIWFLTFKWIVPKCCQIMPQPGKSVGTSQRDHRLPQGYRFLSKEQHPSVTLWSFSRDERTTQPYRPMVCIWKVVGASAPKIVSETDSKGQPSYSASVCKALRKRVLSKTRVTLRNATNKISAPTPLVTRSQPAPRDQFRHDA